MRRGRFGRLLQRCQRIRRLLDDRKCWATTPPRWRRRLLVQSRGLRTAVLRCDMLGDMEICYFHRLRWGPGRPKCALARLPERHYRTCAHPPIAECGAEPVD